MQWIWGRFCIDLAGPVVPAHQALVCVVEQAWLPRIVSNDSGTVFMCCVAPAAVTNIVTSEEVGHLTRMLHDVDTGTTDVITRARNARQKHKRREKKQRMGRRV